MEEPPVEEDEEESKPQSKEAWMSKLHQVMKYTDYYGLLESNSNNTLPEIATKRKEINNRLRPDHFQANSSEKEAAV